MTSHALHPDRRQFLAALTVALTSRRFPWPATANAFLIKTLAEYQAEAATYSGALTALAVTPTSLTAHTALSARVGSGLTRRVSWIIAEAAQDPRVVAGVKSLLASSSGFSTFTRAFANDTRAILTVPGLQVAISDAMAREAALRRATRGKQSAFAALLQQQVANLPDLARRAELDAIAKRLAAQQGATQAVLTVIVVVAIVVAVVVATTSFGAAGPIATTAAAAAVASVGVTAAAVAAFSQEAAKQADAARNALQDCLDAADARRRSCRNAITTPFQLQRDAEWALCELAYLDAVFFCEG